MSEKFKLSDLDFNNIGGWPQKAKLGFSVIAGFLICVVAYFLLIQGQRDELESLESKETSLRQDFSKKQNRAANLEPLKAQMQEMETVFQQMLRQLPSKTEMPDLIVDISQTALSSGLESELFEPQPEQTQEFYAEKPIALRFVGSYHEFGAFVSGVANMPRVVIMTMHDISLKPRENKVGDASENLVLEGTIKTYRYLDPDEQAIQDEKIKAAEKEKKKTNRTAAKSTKKEEAP